MRTFLLALMMLALAPAAHAGATLLDGADLYAVSHGVIPHGQLLIVDGRIAALGTQVVAPAGATRIDVRGKRIYPGLIAANSVLGLTEIEAVRATDDQAEVGAINPNARALVVLNPDSELLPVTRANGVLSVHVVPQIGPGGVFSGQSAVVSLAGWTWEDMRVLEPAGVHLVWPELDIPAWVPAAMAGKARDAQRKQHEALAQVLRDARSYAASLRGGPPAAPDLRWQALLPALDGRVPLFIHADGAVALREVLDFITRERIGQPVLVGGADAWRVADVLAARKIPLILGPRQRAAAASRRCHRYRLRQCRQAGRSGRALRHRQCGHADGRGQ